MSDDQLFERNARVWLERGPTSAPKRVVEAALLTVQTTPQRRDLLAPWRFPHMTRQTRFAVAAAVGLLAVGAGLLLLRSPQSQVGTPSPSPTASPGSTPISLAGLQGAWASVGTRADPFLNGGDSGVQTMALDAAALRINGWKGELTSSASIARGDGLLILRMDAPQDLLTREKWACTTGDSGTYHASLSPDEQTLTLTSASDDCASRDEILTGDWTRWSCPTSQYAYCDHVSELTPGRYVSPVFRPFGGGTSGQLAYTIPAGWAKLSQPPTWPPSAGSPTSLGLTRLASPERPSIYVYSNLKRSAPTTDCSSGIAAPTGTASSVADWLASLSYLAVSQRTPVTIGGLSGLQLDLSLTPGFTDPCSDGGVTGGSVEYATGIEIFTSGDGENAIYMDTRADDHARFIVLDTDDGRMVIALFASDQPALDALIAQAMPVIESFEFIP